MARKLNKISKKILEHLSQNGKSEIAATKQATAPHLSGKDFYNYLFRLQSQELITKKNQSISLS